MDQTTATGSPQTAQHMRLQALHLSAERDASGQLRPMAERLAEAKQIADFLMDGGLPE